MQKFLTLLRILPMIISAVRAAEDFIPLAGAGKIKLDLVLAAISEAYESSLGSLSGSIKWSELLPAVTKMIASIVVAMNAGAVHAAATAPVVK